jgi:hypothetical protein
LTGGAKGRLKRGAAFALQPRPWAGDALLIYNCRHPFPEEEIFVRTLLRVSIPVEAGNAAAKAGTLGSTVEKILADLKPEAAYFFADDNGNRSGSIVFDLKDTSDIPAIAEPWFLAFNAKVSFRPVMNAQDLAKGAPAIGKAVAQYGK